MSVETVVQTSVASNDDAASTAKKICQNLYSRDRRTRKATLLELDKFLNLASTDFDIHQFFNDTQMYIITSLRDPNECVREQAIVFLETLYLERLPLNDFYLTYLFPVITERIGMAELNEESEEIRLQLLKFVEKLILKYSRTEQLKPFLDDCYTILKHTALDKFPAIKETTCNVVVELAEALPRDFHLQAETLIKPLVSCFYHQRYKVRMAAILAVGEVVLHSSFNGLNEAIGPMAERLFDQIPTVRRTVASVAARWLTVYRDRYSFFHNILPLILTGLHDEVLETREHAAALWATVGLQYQQENEKDLKDQLDFVLEPPQYYPENLKRPNLGCRILVQRNIIKLAPALAVELSSWQSDIRVRCSQLLCALVWHAESNVTQNLQDLLNGMYVAVRDNDQRVTDNIMEAAKLIGTFVSPKTWTKLILPLFDEHCHYGHVAVLTGLITGTPYALLDNFLNDIATSIADDQVCLTRKAPFQHKLLECVIAILEKGEQGAQLNDIAYYLFKIIVGLVALKNEGDDQISLVSLGKLNEVCNYDDQTNCWNVHLGQLLTDIDKNSACWTLVTPYKCIFDTCLLHSGTAFGTYLPQFVSILTDTLNSKESSDWADCHLKTFWALTEAFNAKDTTLKNVQNKEECILKLVTEVFVPALVWHAGKNAEAIRTMAACCLKYALEPQRVANKVSETSQTQYLVSKSSELRLLFDKLIPLLLSLLEDASHRSRVFSVECIERLKQAGSDMHVWNTDDLIRIYPEIIKRLDDPIEYVRVAALKILPTIFDACPKQFFDTHFKAHHEFIIDTLLIHIEDMEVAHLIVDVFKKIVFINCELVKSKVEAAHNMLHNRSSCDEIMMHLQEIRL